VQVSFVIPVFDQMEHTRACLDAMRDHIPPALTHEVILVDDGSKESTRRFLAGLSSEFRVIHLEKNHGFARATNAGAEIARGRWLCLLNNDVQLTAGAMEELLSAAESKSDAGIVGNIQVTTDTGEVDHAGIEFRDQGYPRHIRGELTELQTAGDVVPALAVTAACCLVDREWFVTGGGLDSHYRNGFEDVDLCLRAREDGWGIYVANLSVVQHAVSTSEGRGRHEFRNARLFLERWGDRTAALQTASEKAAARRYRLQRAIATVDQPAAPSIKSQRAAEIARADRERSRADKPITVWIDILRMEPGGANGGIKPLVYDFLKLLTRLDAAPQHYVVLAREHLLPELNFLRASDHIATNSSNGWQLHSGDQSESQASDLTALKAKLPPDVLYCPFGTSAFTRNDLPSVALLVDALHRDQPAALPIEEVNFSEDNFKRVIGSATWLQTLAQHGIDRLQVHWGVKRTQCFHTYVPVQQRLTPPTASVDMPTALPAENYFIYPANFWPHKNHETLITAYHLYAHESDPAQCWQLVLTGFPDARQESLRQMSSKLGLDQQLHFAGHLPHDQFVTLYQKAGALVFPSLHEGFGIPLLEAFANDLPVLAAQVSALPEVGGEACHWFDPTDPRAVAAALTRIATDPNRRAELIAAGQRRLHRFSLTTEVRRLHHFLQSAARGLVP